MSHYTGRAMPDTPPSADPRARAGTPPPTWLLLPLLTVWAIAAASLGSRLARPLHVGPPAATFLVTAAGAAPLTLAVLRRAGARWSRAVGLALVAGVGLGALFALLAAGTRLFGGQ